MNVCMTHKRPDDIHQNLSSAIAMWAFAIIGQPVDEDISLGLKFPGVSELAKIHFETLPLARPAPAWPSSPGSSFVIYLL